MKLQGTKTETELRARLEKSQKAIFDDPKNVRILLAIRSCVINLESACVLDWIPEQGEEIHTVLVNGDRVLVIELDREEKNQPILKEIDIKEYRKGLSRSNQLKLAIAQELRRPGKPRI